MIGTSQSLFLFYFSFRDKVDSFYDCIGIKNKGGCRIFLWLLYQYLLCCVRLCVHAVSEGIICHRLSSSSSSSSSPTSYILSSLSHSSRRVYNMIATPSQFVSVPIHLLSSSFCCCHQQQIHCHPNHHHRQLQSCDTISL